MRLLRRSSADANFMKCVLVSTNRLILSRGPSGARQEMRGFVYSDSVDSAEALSDSGEAIFADQLSKVSFISMSVNEDLFEGRE